MSDEPFTPLELFSPSGLSTARDGARKWSWIYILNLREPKTLWVDIKDEEKPVAKIKSKPTEAEKKALKEYNRRRRPALGTEVHARIEHYMKGGQVDWSDVPGTIALSGLPHLPSPKKCALVETEAAISIDLSFMGDVGPDPIVFRGTRDLFCSVKHPGAGPYPDLTATFTYLLIDHKTTYTFDFIDREKTIKTVKTPEQLIEDEQANLYGLDVMQKHGLQELACRWVYYRTEGDPAAKQVDFTITRAGAEARVARMVEQALTLRDLMRTSERTPEAINLIECDVNSCGKFGGCTYHPEQGGPCTPPVLTMGERLVQIRNKTKKAQALKQATKESKHMAGLGFRDRAKAQEAANAAKAAAPAAPVEQTPAEEIEVAGEVVDELEAGGIADEEGEVTYSGAAEVKEAAAEAQAPLTETAQEKARKARGPNKAKPPAVAGGLGNTLAELSQALIANEAEHAAIVANMRAALGAQ